MTCSAHGLNGMSVNFHRFIKENILPEGFNTTRPVVLNTWEASYFDIDSDEMLRYAKADVYKRQPYIWKVLFLYSEIHPHTEDTFFQSA